MPLLIGVPAETLVGERRIAIVPDVAKKYLGQGASVLIQKGAGVPAHYRDADFADVSFADTGEAVFSQADVVLRVQPPSAEEIAFMKPGAVLVGMLQPWSSAERVRQFAEHNISAFALELLPRISRAQSMDILSSQAAVAGYECALIAADHSPKFFPMLTYAAGSIRPAKVLVIGAGVAGLQAIATARRLGAVVEAFDVRPAVRDEVQSLGATFVGHELLDQAAVAAGGYAKEMSPEQQARQRQLVAERLKQSDVVISTAMVPGRKAPILIPEATVREMRPGSVIVDLAAEMGGNCELTQPGADIVRNGVTILGPVNLAATVPVHASQMYARNVTALLKHLVKDGRLHLDFEDEITRETCLVRPAGPAGESEAGAAPPGAGGRTTRAAPCSPRSTCSCSRCSWASRSSRRCRSCSIRRSCRAPTPSTASSCWAACWCSPPPTRRCS